VQGRLEIQPGEGETKPRRMSPGNLTVTDGGDKMLGLTRERSLVDACGHLATPLFDTALFTGKERRSVRLGVQ